MSLAQARLDLSRAVHGASATQHSTDATNAAIASHPGATPRANTTPSGLDRFRAAKQVLVTHGAAALGIDPATAPELAELVERAVRAPAGPARRIFAVLLVDALGVPDLLSVRSSRARLDRDIRALVESALPDVLLRSGYPFAGDPDEKRRAVARLHASIDEHLQPPEPSIPVWLSGRPIS